MARGKSWKLKQNQVAASALGAVAHSPELVSPPGLPVPPALAQEIIKHVTEVDPSVPRNSAPPLGLVPPPRLALFQEETGAHECTTQGLSDARSIASTSPMYISVMTSVLEPEHVIAREAASTGMHEVKVTGLPNAMLSDIMFEAVLNQARLDKQYASFETTLGAQFGSALISLHNAGAAEQCVRYFQGRPWGPRGTSVCAHVVNVWPEVSRTSHLHQEAVSNYTKGGHHEFKKPSGLSIDTRAFIPGSSFMSATI